MPTKLARCPEGCLQPLGDAGTSQAVQHGVSAHPYSSALLLAVIWSLALSAIGALLALPISGRAPRLYVRQSATATRKGGFNSNNFDVKACGRPLIHG